MRSSRILRNWKKTCHLNRVNTLLFVFFMFLASSVYWIILNKKTLTQNAINANDIKIPERNQSLKYVLMWQPFRWDPLFYLGPGQQGFLRKQCPKPDCYITGDRNLFGGDLTKFDAVLFNGRSLEVFNIGADKLPKLRSPHQKYIYEEMESPDNFPVCDPIFDGYFNWTATYRVESEIPYAYILIKDSNGKVVGPSKNINWVLNMSNTDEQLNRILENKTKAAAWFVSRCKSRGRREKYVRELEHELKHYDLTVDIYGRCGKLQCSGSLCARILERDYFFYLSFENTICEDYTTEKLLTALHSSTLPILYGGSDYSRFLPPGSYLDARAHKPKELAARMHQLMKSPKEYRQYFRWRNHYFYSDPAFIENLCGLCTALHNKSMMETTTVYKEFRKWWHPSYDVRCKKN